jgi:hypothetical protein
MSAPSKADIEYFLKEIWSMRDRGDYIPNLAWDRPIRHQDVEYLLRQYPFLQIVSTEPNFASEEEETKLVVIPNGWVVHDYGEAMSTSPGKLLYGAGAPDLKKEDEEGGSEGGGSGTIIKQGFDAAQSMVLLAIEKQWPGIQIVSGTQFMQWSAWMAAADRNIPIQGYEPSEADKLKRKRVKEYLSEHELVQKYTRAFGR